MSCGGHGNPSVSRLARYRSPAQRRDILSRACNDWLATFIPVLTLNLVRGCPSPGEHINTVVSCFERSCSASSRVDGILTMEIMKTFSASSSTAGKYRGYPHTQARWSGLVCAAPFWTIEERQRQEHIRQLWVKPSRKDIRQIAVVRAVRSRPTVFTENVTEAR